MSKIPNVVSLAQHRRALRQSRRAERALNFFVHLLGGGAVEDVTAIDSPLPGVKHMVRMGMDIAITREPTPKYSREVLHFARRRSTGFIIVRFRDPARDIGEALIDAFLVEGNGVAVLERLSPVKPGHFWVLVGPNNGDVNLRVVNGELVPTLSVPWPRGGDRDSLVARSDRLFSDYIWAE